MIFNNASYFQNILNGNRYICSWFIINEWHNKLCYQKIKAALTILLMS